MRLLICLAVLLSACASQSTHNRVMESPWVSMTQQDVQAAYQILLEDHPAMSPLVGDKSFRDRVEYGRALALSRASQVLSYEGYLAVMAGFANSAGDKHVWSRASLQSDSLEWPGFVVSLRGAEYVVTAIEHDFGSPELLGATLMSCDNIDAKDFAKMKLGGFHAVWSVPAQRIQSAPKLMLNFGNPFVLLPEKCRFFTAERGTGVFEHALNWQAVNKGDLDDFLSRAKNQGAAGFGLKRIADNRYWIAIESFSASAGDVVNQVRAEQDNLKNAHLVVVDLRGNSGGNSQYGDQIARVLFGDDQFDKLIGSRNDQECDSSWRISDRNLKRMRFYQRYFESENPEFAELFKPILASAETAAIQGNAFSAPIICGKERSSGVTAAQRPDNRRVVVVTDNACFSSCLIVVDHFRQLGALHVGQTTDSGTRYMEVREDKLPSGLSYFSTLQAISPSSPLEYGSFKPDRQYDGDISDSDALGAWVLNM